MERVPLCGRRQRLECDIDHHYNRSSKTGRWLYKTGSISDLSAQSPHYVLQYLHQLALQFSNWGPLISCLTPPPGCPPRKAGKTSIRSCNVESSWSTFNRQKNVNPSYSTAGKLMLYFLWKPQCPNLVRISEVKVLLGCSWLLAIFHQGSIAFACQNFQTFVHLLISCHVHES
jgi:hypothetical protein